MARISSISIAFFVIFALNFAIDIALAQQDQNTNVNDYPNGEHGSLRRDECPRACADRCSATSHRKPCMFFCNKCCEKCLCVPSGTYGHKEECPCYNNWKTKEGGPKCP